MAKNMWFSLKKIILWTSARFFYEFLAYSQKCEEHFNIFTLLSYLWPNLAKLSDRWWPLQLHHTTGKQNNESSQKVLLNATSCSHGICYHFPLCMKLDFCHLNKIEMTDMSMEVYTTWFALVWMSELLNWVRCLASVSLGLWRTKCLFKVWNPWNKSSIPCK